jgi:hypothetical protein
MWDAAIGLLVEIELSKIDEYRRPMRRSPTSAQATRKR